MMYLPLYQIMALVPPSRFMACMQSCLVMMAAQSGTLMPTDVVSRPSTSRAMISPYFDWPRQARGCRSEKPLRALTTVSPSMIMAGENSTASVVPGETSESLSRM